MEKENNMETLEERIKYWHIRCMNCDEKVHQFLKSDKEGFITTFDCPLCKDKIKVIYGMEIKSKDLFKELNSQKQVAVLCNTILV